MFIVFLFSCLKMKSRSAPNVKLWPFLVPSFTNIHRSNTPVNLGRQYVFPVCCTCTHAPEDALADALCGSTDQVRPRYGALAFLVEGKGTRRGPVDMRQASILERQDWSLASPIQAVFEKAELSDGRQKDATVMALSAIFEGQEEKVIQRERPWGRPATNQWSYEKVKSEFLGVESRVIAYLALMHVTVEIAQSSDGICGE